MLFPRPPVGGAPPRPPFAEQVWLTTSFGRIEAWYLPPLQSSGTAPLLVFTHGNGELIDYWPEEFDAPRGWGLGVLLVEYPGYGRSDGTPSQPAIREGMLAAYDWAQRKRTSTERIIPYGRSLGGGAAAIVARARPVPALISRIRVFKRRGICLRLRCAAILVPRSFDSVAALELFKGPDSDPARRSRRHRAAKSRPRAGRRGGQRDAEVPAMRPQRLPAALGRCSRLPGSERLVASGALTGV